jgi:O-antigen ligase
MKAKYRSFNHKSAVNPKLEKSLVSINNTGWKSMINWLMVLAAILPLLFTRTTMDPVLPIRYIFLGSFILLFILFFYTWQKIPLNLSFPPLIKVVFTLGIAYGVWSIIALFFSINKAAASYETARHLLNLILLFLVRVAVRRESTGVIKLCKALVIVSLIQSLVGILQIYGIAFMDIPGTAQPYGLMVHRNLFGSAQALLLPYGLFVLYKGEKRWKYVSIMAIIGIVESVLISQTRSAWLATIALVVTALILIVIFSRLDRKIWLIGTSIGIVGTAALVWLLIISDSEGIITKAVTERATNLSRPTVESHEASGSAIQRLKLWNKSLDLIQDHPLQGVGAGNWNLAIWAYGSEGMYWSDGSDVPGRPHNVYLQVACETGIPGALLYFSMWIIVVVVGFKTIRKTNSEDIRMLTILMLAGLAAFATDSLFSFPTERIEHALYIILIGGIILGLNTPLPVPEKEKESAMKQWLIRAAVFITAFNVFIGYKKYNFEKHMNLAIAYRSENRFAAVIREVEAGKSIWVTIAANGDPLEIHSSVAYRELGNYQKALKEIQTAKSYHPYNPRIYTTMGVVYAKLEQYDKAIDCFLQALKFIPQYDIVLKNLAVAYFESGNYAACIETLKKVYIQDTPYLINLFNEAQKQHKFNHKKIKGEASE